VPLYNPAAGGGGVVASDQGFVNHGSTAGTSRPATYGTVTWIGSVAPTNAVNDDVWLNTAPYRLEVLADAPFGYWPDSDAGPLVDATAGGHNITLAGGATVNVAGPISLGDTKAVQYDGTNDGGSVALDLSDTAVLTVEFWLWWDAFANDDDMAMEFTASASSNTGGFFIDPNAAAGSFNVLHQGAAGSNVKSWLRPTAAAWHHYAFVLDMASKDTTQEILGYLDGAFWPGLQGTATDSTNNFANSTLNVMCRNGASLFGAGKMAHLAIYKKRLAAGRVNAHYNASRAPRAFLRVAGAWTETSA
jgi:hypothetical protein